MNTAITEARKTLFEGKVSQADWVEDIARRLSQGVKVDPGEISDACPNPADLDALETRVAILNRIRELAEIVRGEAAARKIQDKVNKERRDFTERKKATLKKLDDEGHELLKRGNHASSKMREISRARAELERIGDRAKVRRATEAGTALANQREIVSQAKRELENEGKPENASALCLSRAKASLEDLQGQLKGDEGNPRLQSRIENCERSIEYYTKTSDAARLKQAKSRHDKAQLKLTQCERELKDAWKDLCNEA